MDKKMTKSIVYFDALSEEAKERARAWYREGDNMPFLEEYLTEFVRERLVKMGYEVQSLEMHYSLACCQGDGVSFDAVLIKGKRMYTVKQHGSMYVHEMTMSAHSELYYDGSGEERDEPKFLERMRKLARETEKLGYKYIDDEQADDNVDDNILANEYTFTLEGVRMNPD